MNPGDRVIGPGGWLGTVSVPDDDRAGRRSTTSMGWRDDGEAFAVATDDLLLISVAQGPEEKG